MLPTGRKVDTSISPTGDGGFPDIGLALLAAKVCILGPVHGISVCALVLMNGIVLVGPTHQVVTKRFAVAWDTGAMAGVYGATVILVYVMRG